MQEMMTGLLGMKRQCIGVAQSVGAYGKLSFVSFFTAASFLPFASFPTFASQLSTCLAPVLSLLLLIFYSNL